MVTRRATFSFNFGFPPSNSWIRAHQGGGGIREKELLHRSHFYPLPKSPPRLLTTHHGFGLTDPLRVLQDGAEVFDGAFHIVQLHLHGLLA